jgi:hypothetical protein
MRILILILCLSTLFAGMPARKADALAGYYRQFHKKTTPKQCPTNYRWDAHAALCRRPHP